MDGAIRLVGRVLNPEHYVEEGVIMGYTAEDFHREYIATLSPEERLRGLSSEEIESYLKKLKNTQGK